MRNIAVAAAVAMFAAQPIHAGEVMYRMCIKGLQDDVLGLGTFTHAQMHEFCKPQLDFNF